VVETYGPSGAEVDRFAFEVGDDALLELPEEVLVGAEVVGGWPQSRKQLPLGGLALRHGQTGPAHGPVARQSEITPFRSKDRVVQHL